MSEIQKIKDVTAKAFEACYEHWKLLDSLCNNGAVKWSENENGALIIYTRGEYKKKILKNIFEMGLDNHREDISLSDGNWVNENNTLKEKLEEAEGIIRRARAIIVCASVCPLEKSHVIELKDMSKEFLKGKRYEQ